MALAKKLFLRRVKLIQASGADVELSEFDWGADRYLRDGSNGSS